MNIRQTSMMRNFTRKTPSYASSAPRSNHMTAMRIVACTVICTCLALAGTTQAEEAASEGVAQTSPAQAATAQTNTTPDTSAALLRVVALRQELEAQVKALARLVEYQKELLALAKTSDVDAVLSARRQTQSCATEINAPALCAALGVSFTDDKPEHMPDRGER